VDDSPATPFQAPSGRRITAEEAINLMVSLVATDTQARTKWRGFYNSLSIEELHQEWDACW
jgi:hypothetical protein